MKNTWKKMQPVVTTRARVAHWTIHLPKNHSTPSKTYLKIRWRLSLNFLKKWILKKSRLSILISLSLVCGGDGVGLQTNKKQFLLFRPKNPQSNFWASNNFFFELCCFGGNCFIKHFVIYFFIEISITRREIWLSNKKNNQQDFKFNSSL